MTLYLNPQAKSFTPSIEFDISIEEKNNISFDHIDSMFDWINDNNYWNEIDNNLIYKSEFKQKYKNVLNELNENIRKKNIKKIHEKNINNIVDKIYNLIRDIQINYPN